MIKAITKMMLFVIGACLTLLIAGILLAWAMVWGTYLLDGVMDVLPWPSY